jgi:hypothetical protein
LDKWHDDRYGPQSASDKALKNFLIATIAAMGFAMETAGMLDAGRYSGLDVMVGGLVTAVIGALAMGQLALWAELNFGDDSSYFGGFTDEFYDVNPGVGKTLPWD